MAPAETKQWPAAGPSAAEPGPVVVASRPDLLAQVFPPADEYGAPPVHAAAAAAAALRAAVRAAAAAAATAALLTGGGARRRCARRAIRAAAEPGAPARLRGSRRAAANAAGWSAARIHADLPAEAIDDVAVLPSVASIVPYAGVDALAARCAAAGVFVRRRRPARDAVRRSRPRRRRRARAEGEAASRLRPRVDQRRASTAGPRAARAARRAPRGERHERDDGVAPAAAAAARCGNGVPRGQHRRGAPRPSQLGRASPRRAGPRRRRSQSWPPSAAAAAAATAASAARQAWAARGRGVSSSSKLCCSSATINSAKSWAIGCVAAPDARRPSEAGRGCGEALRGAAAPQQRPGMMERSPDELQRLVASQFGDHGGAGGGAGARRRRRRGVRGRRDGGGGGGAETFLL